MMDVRKTFQLLGRMDFIFALAVLALMIIGILFIYSASYRNDDQWMTALTRRQVVWSLVGLACFFAALMVDYRRLAVQAWWVYGLCLLLLVDHCFDRFWRCLFLAKSKINQAPAKIPVKVADRSVSRVKRWDLDEELVDGQHHDQEQGGPENRFDQAAHGLS